MKGILHFTWSDAVCCDLCNPAKLADYEQNGVVVVGPTWRRAVCIRCIMVLEDFFSGVPARSLELEPNVADVFEALGGARLDIPTCQCGRALAGRSDLVGQLQTVIADLLQLPQNARFDMAIAAVMHAVLRVVSLLERCEQCADTRIAEAVMTIARSALQRPYTKPTIEVLGPLPRRDGNGGTHDE